MTITINPILYVTYPLSAFLIFVLALGLGFFLTKRFSQRWYLYWIGAITFILSQIAHIPFNIFLTGLFRMETIPTPADHWLPVTNALILGMSAALFEEFARYIVLRGWVKQARGWKNGLIFGAGHAGMEALLVAGLIFYGFLVMTTLQGRDLTPLVSPEQLPVLRAQVEAYWAATWYDSLLGFVERALTIPIQIALAVLVMQAVDRMQSRWLLLALLWHTLVDAVVFYAAGVWGAYTAEGILSLFTVCSLGMIYYLRDGSPAEDQSSTDEIPQASVSLPGAQLPSIEETIETINQTRYTNGP